MSSSTAPRMTSSGSWRNCFRSPRALSSQALPAIPQRSACPTARTRTVRCRRLHSGSRFSRRPRRHGRSCAGRCAPIPREKKPMSGSETRAALSSPRSSALDLIVQGRSLVSAGRARDARPLAEEALRLEPRDADALYLLGEAHYRCGELELAEMRLRQAIQANGKVPLFHSKLGNVLQDRGALDEAIRAYRRAIRLKPDFAEPHNDLG